MARANRHFLPGYIWHITHRCHKLEFLLKFARDRRRLEGDLLLVRCVVYVDLNKVRAGVVKHPSEWAFCGYNEIQSPPKRECLIDIEELMELIKEVNPRLLANLS